MQQRYSHRYESVALGALMRSVRDLVPANELGVVDTAGLIWGQRGAIGTIRSEWRTWIGEHGYARPPTSFSEYGSGDWEYPPLESVYAQHFVDSLFGRLSNFTIARADEDGWELHSCSRREDRPSISGTLAIGRDTTLVSATWTFRTVKPVEHAGGEALFAPAAVPDSAAFLLPTYGLFWQEGVRPNEFHEVWQEFRDWIINWRDVLVVPEMPRSR